mgnify:CR=1 FL=1
MNPFQWQAIEPAAAGDNAEDRGASQGQRGADPGGHGVGGAAQAGDGDLGLVAEFGEEDHQESAGENAVARLFGDFFITVLFLVAQGADAEDGEEQGDCGRDDPFIGANRQLHADLQADGIAHDYAEHDGGHDWGYWALHLEDTLRFFGQALTTRGATA